MKVLLTLETGSNAATDWDFRRTAHPSVVATVGHRRPSTDRVPAHARWWQGGMCRRQLPCHRAAESRSPALPSKHAASGLATGRTCRQFRSATWRNSRYPGQCCGAKYVRDCGGSTNPLGSVNRRQKAHSASGKEASHDLRLNRRSYFT